MAFTNGLAGNVRSQELGYGLYNVTMGVFAGWRGMFIAMQQYLYLYIPLLTMGLMSRELSSGSIKLLYSSPVTNTQIILGKYLSMMIYNLVLMCILAVYLVFAAITIKSADVPLILSGMLGLYLLVCAVRRDRVIHVEHYFLSGRGSHGNLGGVGGAELRGGYVAGY